MRLFSSLRQEANDFLDKYKTAEPATYAAAEQAIGGTLILDGFVGIENPLGGKKRPGIFGAFVGIFFAIIFMLVPKFFGGISGISNMTATTTATVVSVGQEVSTHTQSGTRSGGACSLTANYSVNGHDYTKQSSIDSSNYCPLSEGQTIAINYDPANPGAWIYGAKTINGFMQIFFWAGVLFLVSSVVTFFIRLFSIIFGWKLLKAGRKNAANLPAGTNLQTMIDEIKKNFSSSIFGFGAGNFNPIPSTNPQPPANPTVPTDPNV